MSNVNFNLFLNQDVREQFPNARDIYTVNNGEYAVVEYYGGGGKIYGDIYIPNGCDWWFQLHQECIPIRD